MQPVFQNAKSNPLQNANLCSRIFFWWLNPLFQIGHQRRLEEDDMYSVLPEDRSEVLGEQLQGYWDKEVLKAEKEARKPSLTKAIIKCYWKSYLILGLFTLFEESTKVVQPIFLGKIIEFFEQYDPHDTVALNWAYGYAAALSFCTLFLAILHHLYFYHVQCAGMKLRVAMCHMIYRKALRLSNTAMVKTTTGQIVNLLSNDVNKFDQVTIFLHFLWAGPIQAIAVTALLWLEIGVSCLAGMAVLLILLPLQSCFGKLFSSLRSQTAAFTDIRIRTMNEVIMGIRIIKMYAWEKPFADLIAHLRRKEISKILKSSYLRGINLASFFVASKIIVFVTFTTYVLLGNVITASRVFVAVTLYGAVRLTVTLFFPAAIEKMSEARISIKRIKEFLILDEVHPSGIQPQKDEKALVHVQDFTSYWDKTLEVPTLRNLSFTVRPRELLAVVGPVGSGKSSLLCAVLGELPRHEGLVTVKGRIAYVSQQPWVFSGTVRSNILFGKTYEKERYDKVIKACALKKDLKLLEDGDLTLIGDRGTTLSGGQKARINLARAVYQDADIYLLDDPLSAVDGEVGRHLFEHCICQTLHEKVTILVTHQLQYLQAASQILILKEGKVVEKGTYTEFQKSGVDFGSLLKKENEETEQSQVPEVPLLRNRSFSESSMWSQHSSKLSYREGPAEQQGTEAVPVGVSEESRSEGHIGFKSYRNYFAAGANCFIIVLLILLNFLAQVAYVLQDWWLSYWANEQSKLNVTVDGIKGNETRKLDLNWYLGTYAGLTAVTVLFGIVRCLLVFYVLVNASQTLHNKMFESILRAPVLFFDRNPIGRILNRFSKDIGHLDDLLPLTFLDFIQTLLQVIGVVAVAMAVIPWIALPLIPLAIIFIFLRRYFLETSRDVKRLESTTRSPVFSHLSSSLQGLWTIRAYRAEQRLQELFDAHQDLHSGLYIFGNMLEPVLFTGTMRKNLDPFDEYTDEELWNALKEVQLKEAIEDLPGKMDTELAEAGSNFSVGQRQLVCLARAILRKNRILIIDEATANVDPRTDELIQKTIREKFDQCTVLTIAHRLNTIIDSDKIMVLEAGRLKEYDEPYVLLQNNESLFYKMVQQTGKAEAAVLTEIAQQVYFRRNYPEVTQNGYVVTNTSNERPSRPVVFETAL
ncbi:ATP-binding cassette sub-family C member 4 [Gracilinanus agilis]|uniref:ATP-binding cassette sub-family C member 4 n=1 Tax=Gracilinanus agilis TaxID=191870 RepID=UPI001CFC88CB|nr:ATP-binding cassette sub-family C member 4 [Gracilinanus agilis]